MPMNKAHSKILDKKMALLLGAMVILYILMATFGPSDSLDRKLYYSGEEARALMQSFGGAELKAYFVNELLDLLLIFSYTGALFLGLQRVYSRHIWVLALSLLVGAADFIETSTILSVLRFWVWQAAFDWSIGLYLVPLRQHAARSEQAVVEPGQPGAQLELAVDEPVCERRDLLRGSDR